MIDTFPTCTIVTSIKDPAGNPVAGATILAELNQKVIYKGIIIPRIVVAYTDKQGNATINLWPNVLDIGDYTYYKIIIKWPNNRIETMNIRVPDQVTAKLSNLEIQDIPENLSDNLNSILATVAEVEDTVNKNAKQVEEDRQLIDSRLTSAEAVLQKATALGNTIEGFSQQAIDIENKINAFNVDYPKVQDALTAVKTDVATIASDKLSAQVAASDAATNFQGTTDNLHAIETIKSDIDNIYQQILTNLPHGSSQVSIQTIIRETYNYMATQGQTTFSGQDLENKTLAYKVGLILVYKNGILLKPRDDYTATDGSSVVMTEPSDVGDWIAVIEGFDASFSQFQDLANQASASAITAKAEADRAKSQADQAATGASTAMTAARAAAASSTDSAASAAAAKSSQLNAKLSETNSKAMEDSITNFVQIATDKATQAGASATAAQTSADSVPGIIADQFEKPEFDLGTDASRFTTVNFPGLEPDSIVTVTNNKVLSTSITATSSGWARVTLVGMGGYGAISAFSDGRAVVIPTGFRTVFESVSAYNGVNGAAAADQPLDNSGKCTYIQNAECKYGGVGLAGDGDDRRTVIYKGVTYTSVVAGGRGGASGVVLVSGETPGWVSSSAVPFNIGCGAGMYHPIATTLSLNATQRRTPTDITAGTNTIYWPTGISNCPIPFFYPFINGSADKDHGFYGTLAADGSYTMSGSTTPFGFGGGSYGGITDKVMAGVQGGGGGGVVVMKMYVTSGQTFRIYIPDIKTVHTTLAGSTMFDGNPYEPIMHGGFPPGPGLIIIEPITTRKSSARVRRAADDDPAIKKKAEKELDKQIKLSEEYNELVSKQSKDYVLTDKELKTCRNLYSKLNFGIKYDERMKYVED